MSRFFLKETVLGIKRNSISFKSIVLYVILTVVLVSVFNFIIWENQSDLIIRNQKLISETQFIQLKNAIRRYSDKSASTSDLEIFSRISEQSIQFGAKEMTVYKENGGLVFPNSGELHQAAEEELVRINRAIAKQGLEDRDFYPVMDASNTNILLYLPVNNPNVQEMMVFKFTLPMQNMEKERNVLLRLCFLVGAFVLLLQIFFAFFLHKLVIAPIVNLEKIVHQIAQGDFTQRIDLHRDDEIGHLASSFNEMTQSLIRIREEAKGSNPLTGLPGNNVIVKMIEGYIHSGNEFAIIYGDLDNFKAYNDKYGFSKGDDAILYTRDCMSQAGKKFGDDSTFVGHEGGDDFVIITSFATWEAICRAVVSSFDAEINQFYSETDAKNGFIDSVDRQGKRVRFPLMSISLAVVSNHFRKISDHRVLVSAAAEMKKFVKKSEGSTFAIDRRTF